MQQISAANAEVTQWRDLVDHTDQVLELLDLAQGEDDGELLSEIAGEADTVHETMARLSHELLLSGKHDHRDAILSIYSGAGGTESQDWAEMLLRMYLRWGEAHGFKTELMEAVSYTHLTLPTN